MEEYENVIELIDDQGESVEFEYLMTLDYEKREYILLRPLDKDYESEEDEVVILRVEQDENGDDIYTSIDDEDEANLILDAFNQVIDQDESEWNS